MKTAVETQSYWAGAASLLVRFRVPISSLLFLGLIAEDLLFWTLPTHGWSRGATWQGYLGAAVVLAGLAIRSWAAGILPKGIDLATNGPYSLCRHPLYLGSFLMMFGFCTLIGYWHDFIVIFGPILGIYLLTMRSEERRLEVRYGGRWKAYAQATSALVPYKLGNYSAGQWSAQRWRKCREYRALGVACAGLAALEIWRLNG